MPGNFPVYEIFAICKIFAAPVPAGSLAVLAAAAVAATPPAVPQPVKTKDTSSSATD